MSIWRIGAGALAALIAAGALAAESTPPAGLTAEQIVDRYIEARGGLDAWRKIETMAWGGRIEMGSASAPGLPFLLEFKRPNKSRFEILAESNRSVRVFDGTRGWSVRTSESGARVLRAYGASELHSAREAHGIDGVLMDHRAKGIDVTLAGIDEVEGRPAYQLNVRLPDRARRRVWDRRADVPDHDRKGLRRRRDDRKDDDRRRDAEPDAIRRAVRTADRPRQAESATTFEAELILRS